MSPCATPIVYPLVSYILIFFLFYLLYVCLEILRKRSLSLPRRFRNIFSNVSELFPGGGQEWKDQYTKEYQSTVRCYLFEFVSPVADCPSALDHISQLDIISFSFSSTPVLDLSTHSNMTAWSIRDIQVYSTVKKFRSSLPEVFYKTEVLKILGRLTGKHPWRSPNLVKL